MKNRLLFVIGCAPFVAFAADRAGAQVAVVGGGSTIGFGGLGVQSSTVVGGSLIATPGMTVGVVTPWLSGIGGAQVAYVGPYGAASFAAPGYVGGYYPYGYYEPWYPGGFALPPLVIPAETVYGPGPVRRMMGLDPPLGTPIIQQTTIQAAPANNAPANNGGPAAGGGFGVLAGGPQVPARPNVRASNAAARESARKQIALGDGWFAKQQYAAALEAYRQAARSAPDLADPYVRQTAALTALGRYDDAVDALKFGLRLSTAVLEGEFRVPVLYGDNRLARVAHLEALAQAATDRPSSDLLFLTGVMLFFDDRPQRAAPFFERAAQLAVGETWHIAAFREVLKRLPDEAPAQRAAGDAQPANVRPRAGDAGGREI